MSTMVNDLRSAWAKGERPDARNANLRGADLSYANLTEAIFLGADLSYANLSGANLRWADLRGAILQGADSWGGMRVEGMHIGQVTVIPTPDGWRVTVEVWRGDPDEFRELITGDDGWDGWPHVTSEELVRMRPRLLALADMIDAHAVYHDEALTLVQEKWGDKK